MQDTEWREMRDAAQRLGDEYTQLLEEPGRGEIERLQSMVDERFRGEGVQMNHAEWLIAIRRYLLATEGRSLSGLEMENALRLAFHQRWLFDRMSRLLETLALTPMDGKTSDPLGAVSARGQFRAKKERLRGFKDEKLEAIASASNEELRQTAIASIEDMAQYCRDVVDIGHEFTTTVSEYEVSSGIGKIDRQEMKAMKDVLGKLGVEIEACEKELGLKTDRSVQTYADLFNATLQKGERFAKAHPRQYTWWCPVCNWEGLLLRRKPAEDSLINKLDIWWVWPCPECRAIIAYDQEHPLFDGKMLFWRRAWDLVRQGVIGLQHAAYLHYCAPEHLVVAAKQIYREELPPHVQKEWDEIESKSKPARKDEYQVQETVSDSDEMEE